MTKCEACDGLGSDCVPCVVEQLKRIADVADWWKDRVIGSDRATREMLAHDTEAAEAMMHFRNEVLDRITRTAPVSDPAPTCEACGGIGRLGAPCPACGREREVDDTEKDRR